MNELDVIVTTSLVKLFFPTKKKLTKKKKPYCVGPNANPALRA